jgi:hypothetical protein
VVTGLVSGASIIVEKKGRRHMKSRTSLFQRFFAVGLVWIVAGGVAVVRAQTPAPPPGSQPPAQLLSPQQLDDLVAPIALYPDPMLSQVLVASTYPLEVVEAQQWVQKNSGLTGTALVDAAKAQNWDPSVQALVAFPNVLSELNQDIRWTTDLGNAFLAQQADVMSAVQRMRASARSNGKLNSSPQQVVTQDTENGQSAIEIQPADPQIMYVPTYDPSYVWGPPAYGYYPSLLYPDFGFGFWPGFNVGLCFGGWGWGGWGGWGWGANWFGHGLFVNHAFFRNYGFRGGVGGFAGRGAWSHDPSHRLGVGYPNRGLSQRYGAISRASAANMGSRFNGGAARGFNGGAARSFNGGAARSYNGGAARNYNGGAARSYNGGAARSYNGGAARSYNGGAARSYNGGAARSYNGGAARSYNGGAARSYSAPRGYSGGAARGYSGGAARSYSAPRSFGGGGARSFGGGGARSFGGGGARSFGGGGGHSFGGGGGHSFGGGGGHGGGGHGGGGHR